MENIFHCALCTLFSILILSSVISEINAISIHIPFHPRFNKCPGTATAISSKSNVINDTSIILSSSTSLISISASSTIGKTSSVLRPRRKELTFYQTMFAGAISRTIAQTVMHPANTYKTLLQLRCKTVVNSQLITFDRLLRGADAQFLLSLPHGAFHFFVIEKVKEFIMPVIQHGFSNAQNVKFLDAITDFASSAISTVVCSVISTPQMVLTDRLMADIYPSFPAALRTIFNSEGLAGFYAGWWPALAQKIPSYSLTWMFFQQLKRLHYDLFDVKPSREANFYLGAIAAAGSVVVMIPMDTVKTRLVIQLANTPKPYLGVMNCFYRIFREEGLGAFYRSLPPRLMSVVPMIAIQFGVYEHIKAKFLLDNTALTAEVGALEKETKRLELIRDSSRNMKKKRKEK